MEVPASRCVAWRRGTGVTSPLLVVALLVCSRQFSRKNYGLFGPTMFVTSLPGASARLSPPLSTGDGRFNCVQTRLGAPRPAGVRRYRLGRVHRAVPFNKTDPPRLRQLEFILS